jgi:hypothetical protein
MEQRFEIATELKLLSEGIARNTNVVTLFQFEGGGSGEGGGKESEGTEER